MKMTNSLSVIKSQIMYLYKENPKVHVDTFFKRERNHLENAFGEITAVYPNIFIARLNDGASEKNYTFQYVDLLTHEIDIKELNGLNI